MSQNVKKVNVNNFSTDEKVPLKEKPKVAPIETKPEEKIKSDIVDLKKQNTIVSEKPPSEKQLSPKAE